MVGNICGLCPLFTALPLNIYLLVGWFAESRSTPGSLAAMFLAYAWRRGGVCHFDCVKWYVVCASAARARLSVAPFGKSMNRYLFETTARRRRRRPNVEPHVSLQLVHVYIPYKIHEPQNPLAPRVHAPLMITFLFSAALTSPYSSSAHFCCASPPSQPPHLSAQIGATNSPAGAPTTFISAVRARQHVL